MKTDMKITEKPKTMKRIYYLLVPLLCALCACSGSDADSKDMEKPVISSDGIVANPIECQVYHRGESIPFQYLFTDNVELGYYNIEIHNNFNHHTHSGSAIECPLEPAKKAGSKAWVYNQDFKIPAGLREYVATTDIPIPSDAETGDYHFMVRLTDAASSQAVFAVAIKVVE